MEFVVHSHRFAVDIVRSNKDLNELWLELADAITSIDDSRIIEQFPLSSNRMSLSDCINDLIDMELKQRGWTPQSAIFQGDEYKEKRWRLDFSKRTSSIESGISGMAVEVAFNHGEAIAWNLIKPVLAAEINQVETETQIGSGIGVYICATNDLKKVGAFDSAVGEYEKVLRYLIPMYQKLSVPMIIVGLKAPSSFRLAKRKDLASGKNHGEIIFL